MNLSSLHFQKPPCLLGSLEWISEMLISFGFADFLISKFAEELDNGGEEARVPFQSPWSQAEQALAPRNDIKFEATRIL